MHNNTVDPSFPNNISNMSVNLPPMSSQMAPTNVSHHSANNLEMHAITPMHISRSIQRQGEGSNASPHGSFGFGTEGMPTISHTGHGMSFALPSVTSESVAALAAQATMLAAQLREYEARAALAALHVLPSSSQQADSQTQPHSLGYPTSQQYSTAIAPEVPSAHQVSGTFSMAHAHRSQADQSGRLSGVLSPWPGGGPANVNMEFENADLKMGKQSLDIRKKNDRDKKRRKRGRIGDLLRKLDSCLSPLEGTRQRSINEVLRDAAAAVRESRGVSKDKDETAQLKPGALPASVIRDGLLSIKETGIAIIDNNFTILNANEALLNLIGASSDMAEGCNSTTSTPGLSEDPKVTGSSLHQFIHHSDVHNLQLATQHVTEASYLDEGKRRYLISLRFLQKPMDSCHRDKLKENARSHASKHVKTYDLRPVEIVPCGGPLFGRNFVMFVLPVAKNKTADEILDAIERLAYNMEVADKAFLPMEMADEVDFNGAHKVCKIHADLDPFLVLIRMAEQDNELLNVFESELQGHDPFSASLMKELRLCVPKRTHSSDVFSDVVLEVSSHVKDKIQTQIRREGDQILIQTLMGRCVLFSVNFVKIGDEVLVKPLHTFTDMSDSKLSPNMHHHLKSPGRVRLLATGEVWVSLNSTLPISSPGLNIAWISMNGLISRTANDLISIRRYPVYNNETFSQSRLYRRSAKPEQVALGTCESICHLLSLYKAWVYHRPLAPYDLPSPGESNGNLSRQNSWGSLADLLSWPQSAHGSFANKD
uniref:Uncharacterized protein n=1 Tax=Hanusia phi TaxID=3032 RepID=A0A7S0E4G0_9CRYP|mmetsp:Transcript_16594/g.37900  ORF Transcript_16594/g.37900 Transcript_16594/m.37900 type:complete len:767 (+) Transcript_16594:107-2407(+)